MVVVKLFFSWKVRLGFGLRWGLVIWFILLGEKRKEEEDEEGIMMKRWGGVVFVLVFLYSIGVIGDIFFGWWIIYLLVVNVYFDFLGGVIGGFIFLLFFFMGLFFFCIFYLYLFFIWFIWKGWWIVVYKILVLFFMDV